MNNFNSRPPGGSRVLEETMENNQSLAMGGKVPLWIRSSPKLPFVHAALCLLLLHLQKQNSKQQTLCQHPVINQ